MKSLVYSILFILFLAVGVVAITVKAQETTDWQYQLLPSIHEAFEHEDWPTVATFFSTSVEMTTTTASGVYSNRQAQVVLSDFFANIAIDTLTLDIERTIGEMTLTIGTIHTQEKNYRLHLLMQNKEHIIQQLKIEDDYE